MGHLVIGVGGTGFKALSMLKAQLKSVSPGGELPQNVALLSIDTESPTNALGEEGVATIKGYGGDPLERATEYAWLGNNAQPVGANLMPVAVALDKGGVPTGIGTGGVVQVQPTPVGHITSWFQTDTMLKLLQPQNWNVNIGAARHRQIARLGLFWNVQSPHVSELHLKLSPAIMRATNNNELNVYLVGSTVGGTGAGLFVDVAYLIRQLKGAGVACTVTAFLLLPESFKSVPAMAGNAMVQAQARTYACKREIERFSVGLRQHRRGFRIIYNPYSASPAYSGGAQGSGTLEKLLDAVYYVDGEGGAGGGGGVPIRAALNTTAPEDGCIPLLADAILALLSETGYLRGVHMTNVATDALNQGRLAAPGAAQLAGGAAGGVPDGQVNSGLLNVANFSSGVGVYSIVLPMSHIVDSLAWGLVNATAVMLARPDNTASALSPNRPGSNPGREEVGVFCNFGVMIGTHKDPATQNEQNYTAGSTPFLQDIETQGRLYGDGTSLINTNAVTQVFHDRTATIWQQLLTAHGGMGSPLVTAWQHELSRNFVSSDPNVPPVIVLDPQGMDATAAWNYVKSQSDTHFLHMLGNLVNGAYVGGGSLQSILENTKLEMLQMLRDRLWLHCLNILNGPQRTNLENLSQVQHDRDNSVGYLYDYLSALNKVLTSYQQGLDAGRRKRNAAGGKAGQIKGAYEDRRRKGDANPAPGILGRGARGVRRDFLDAAQELLDLSRLEQIENMVYSMAQEFASDVQGLLGKVQEWGLYLTIGGQVDDANRPGDKRSVTPIAKLSQAAKTSVDARGAQQDSPLREKIWDTQYNDSLYANYSPGGAARVVGQLDWWITKPGEQGRSGFDAQLYHGLQQYVEEEGLAKGLHELAAQTFTLAWQNESILGFLADKQAIAKWKAENVSQRLEENSLIQLSVGDNGIPSAYVVVPAAGDAQEQGYRNMLLQSVRGVPATALNPNNMPPDDPMRPDKDGVDKFRVTYIKWRDIIPVDMINSFALAKPIYNEVQSLFDFPDPKNPPITFPKEVLHAMPGEVRAVGIEARMNKVAVQPPLGVRPLDYEVIQQLEDAEHVKRFARALAWGAISERSEDVENNPVVSYGFDLPARQAGTIVYPAMEYWLNPPGAGRPSLLEALWNWNYHWEDKHPKGQDAQQRHRPSPNMEQAFPSIEAQVTSLKQTKLQTWLDGHTKWLGGVQVGDRALYERLPAERQKRASLRWAEASYLHEQVIQLRAREQQAPTQKEKDAIAMLMVLLWEDVTNANAQWAAELEQANFLGNFQPNLATQGANQDLLQDMQVIATPGDDPATPTVGSDGRQ